MLVIILLNILNSVLAINYCTLCKDERHTMCQYEEGPSESCVNYTKISLTPAEKMYILDIHNDIRNHVASGQESRGALGNQPPAADMFLLEWDEELEAIAQRWADQCISANAIVQHDKCRRTENFEVGQNVVTAISPDVQLPELSVLILNWYKQITSIIPSDVDEFTGIWRGKHQIGQYTQLVWAKTRLVGCAVAAFKETVGDAQYNIRFVCNYGPAGNVVGQSVYQRGKPCSRCPYRTCDEMRPNLCGGIQKNVNIRKPNTIFQKYKDKATTLSNLIDIEDPKINTRFFNFSILNTPKIIESRTDVANTTQFVNFISVEMEKDLVTNINNVTLENTTMKDVVNFTDTYLTNTTIFTTHEENFSDFTYSSTLNNEDYLNIPGSPQTLANRTYMIPIKLINSNDSNSTTSVDNKTNNYLNKSTLFDTLTDVSINRDSYNVSNPVSNTTLSTQWSEDYKRNLKFRVTFEATIELIMGSFFNTSIIPETTKQSITDFTKNRCERIKLNNGIILVQDCEGDSRDVVNPVKKFSSPLHARKIFVKGNDVILPGNRRFKRVSGIWRNGHCRCVQPLRSCSTALDVTQYFFLLVSFMYFVTI